MDPTFASYSKRQDCHTSFFEIQEEKSHIIILSDWAARINTFREGNKCPVTYVFTNIIGHAYKPVFTYRCRVYGVTTEDNGFLKKEAKRNC